MTPPAGLFLRMGVRSSSCLGRLGYGIKRLDIPYLETHLVLSSRKRIRPISNLMLVSLCLALSLLIGCTQVIQDVPGVVDQPDGNLAKDVAELRVERFHFHPTSGWMNDPNGLVYYDGEYHLFYQYNPDELVWGPMHWGHAVSTNLIEWEHLDIALAPDENGTIFSGSAVVDWENTAGFGAEALVAIFTHFDSPRQSQSLAYSTDRGRTWTKFDGNPVLKPPNGVRNFRDPKVFWYEDAETAHWVMALAAGNIILFYNSADLINWEISGGFGITEGATCGVWETPDLFELPVDEGAERYWVLTVGIQNCAPAQGSGTQYFVGEFDGYDFVNGNDKQTVLWADYGADFYAAQSWSDGADDRRIMIGWMNNWRYAQEIPLGYTNGNAWRGQMTVPREMGLTRTTDGIRLTQNPISEIELLRGEMYQFKDIEVSSTGDFETGVEMIQGEIVAEFQIDNVNQVDQIGVKVRTGKDEETLIGYAPKASKVFVTRTASGQTEFSERFTAGASALYTPDGNKVRLQILVDRESVEIFVGDGHITLTELIFPDLQSQGISLFASNGSGLANSLTIYPYFSGE